MRVPSNICFMPAAAGKENILQSLGPFTSGSRILPAPSCRRRTEGRESSPLFGNRRLFLSWLMYSLRLLARGLCNLLAALLYATAGFHVAHMPGSENAGVRR